MGILRHPVHRGGSGPEAGLGVNTKVHSPFINTLKDISEKNPVIQSSVVHHVF